MHVDSMRVLPSLASPKRIVLVDDFVTKGATLLAAHFFPEVADAAARVRPVLSGAERLAVEGVVEAAKDPARLRHLRGVDQAARLVVAPRS